MGLPRFLALLMVLAAAAGMPDRGAAQGGAAAAEDIPFVARLIRARCIFCHGAPLMLAFSNRMLDEGGPAALDVFLAGHHAPDVEAREAIVAFIVDPMNLTREPPPPDAKGDNP